MLKYVNSTWKLCVHNSVCGGQHELISFAQNNDGQHGAYLQLSVKCRMKQQMLIYIIKNWSLLVTVVSVCRSPKVAVIHIRLLKLRLGNYSQFRWGGGELCHRVTHS